MSAVPFIMRGLTISAAVYTSICALRADSPLEMREMRGAMPNPVVPFSTATRSCVSSFFWHDASVNDAVSSIAARMIDAILVSFFMMNFLLFFDLFNPSKVGLHM